MASSRISGIRGQFALILALAAVLPLMGYGLLSIVSLRSGTREFELWDGLTFHLRRRT